MLAGGAELGRELGGEQVRLAFEVEAALAVHDDFLDERAVPGGFLDAGDVDAALAVVGGQRVGEGGLAGGMGALDGQDGAVTQHRGPPAARPAGYGSCPCRGAVNIVFRYADCQIALRGQASHDPVQVLAKNRLSFPVRAA